jgi:hypothetical protein
MESVLTAGSRSLPRKQKPAGIVKLPADQFASEAGVGQPASG